jgi:hypothetical protein
VKRLVIFVCLSLIGLAQAISANAAFAPQGPTTWTTACRQLPQMVQLLQHEGYFGSPHERSERRREQVNKAAHDQNACVYKEFTAVGAIEFMRWVYGHTEHGMTVYHVCRFNALVKGAAGELYTEMRYTYGFPSCR